MIFNSWLFLPKEICQFLQICLACRFHGAVDDLLLEGAEFLHAFAAVEEHGIKLGLGKGGLFAAALDFDKVAIFGEDYVAIDIGFGVFFIAEVEQCFVLPEADADRSDFLFQWLLRDLAFF